MISTTLVREMGQDTDTLLDSLFGQEVILESKENQIGTFLGLCGKKAAYYKQYPMTKILTSSEKGSSVLNCLGDEFSFTEPKFQELWISNRRELLLKQNELKKQSFKEAVYGRINAFFLKGEPLNDNQVSILLKNLEGELEYLNEKNKEIMEKL